MDIDLLFTSNGEAGLICNTNLVQKAIGVVFDTQSGLMTFEFKDMDYMDTNIPVEKEYHEVLDYAAVIHIGAVKDGHIAQAYQVPLMFQDDPYRMESMMKPHESAKPLQDFEYFIKNCTVGQPVHREDLGNEDSMHCVLGDAVPASLEFAPHLARRHTLEAKPHMAPGNVPGLGLGSSGSGGSGVIRRGDRTDRGRKDD